jgi:hypothetical protein
MRIARLLVVPVLFAFAGEATAQRVDSLWTIPAGEYKGRTVRIDPELAARRGSSFLRVSRLKGDKRYVGWNPSRLPARVAFRPGRGITAADSLAFWSILNRMELDVGMRLFEPATIEAGSDPDDVIIVDTRFMPGDDGRTLLSWSTNGGVYDARVYLRSTSTLHSSRVVAHEMMHTLGFGHTTAWNSIMSPNPMAPTSLTAEDVAYTQFALSERGLNEREDMWERLALANEREPQSPRGSVQVACIKSRLLSAVVDCPEDFHFGGGIGARGTSH